MKLMLSVVPSRLPVPVYGYDTPVRVCDYCYNLLNEEVLCDFDETDLDIDQWNSVHYQNESNVHNLGKKSFFKFATQRSRTGTITSGYTSGRSVQSECDSVSSSSSPLSSPSRESASIPSPSRDDTSLSTLSRTVSVTDAPLPSVQLDLMENGLESDTDQLYSDSESTLSGNSDAESNISSSFNSTTEKKPAVGNQWKNFQNIFKGNSLSRNSLRRSFQNLQR